MGVYKAKEGKTKDGRVWFFRIRYQDMDGRRKQYKSGKFAFDGLDKNSGKFLDQNGEVKSSNDLDVLNVRVQSMRNLRLQLNTEAHDATERSLGTQAQKLAGDVNEDGLVDLQDVQMIMQYYLDIIPELGVH